MLGSPKAFLPGRTDPDLHLINFTFCTIYIHLHELIHTHLLSVHPGLIVMCQNRQGFQSVEGSFYVVMILQSVVISM